MERGWGRRDVGQGTEARVASSFETAPAGSDGRAGAAATARRGAWKKLVCEDGYALEQHDSWNLVWASAVLFYVVGFGIFYKTATGDVVWR